MSLTASQKTMARQAKFYENEANLSFYKMLPNYSYHLDLLQPIDKKRGMKKRSCLQCRREFRSLDAGHRICSFCIDYRRA